MTNDKKTCDCLSAKEAFIEAWIQATRIGSDRFNEAVGKDVLWSEEAERKHAYAKFLEWRDQQ